MISKAEFLAFLETHPDVVIELLKSIIASDIQDDVLVPDMMRMISGKMSPTEVAKAHPVAVAALVSILAPYLMEMMK